MTGRRKNVHLDTTDNVRVILIWAGAGSRRCRVFLQFADFFDILEATYHDVSRNTLRVELSEHSIDTVGDGSRSPLSSRFALSSVFFATTTS